MNIYDIEKEFLELQQYYRMQKKEYLECWSQKMSS